MSQLLDHLRETLAPSELETATDSELLSGFVREGELAAFRELVRRHGPMVLAVCRRVLRHHQDAEDAFQAVFFVLARKGGSVHPREKLAAWLYGVAWRVASKARTLRNKQRRVETLTPDPPPQATHDDHESTEWQDILDEELLRLPEKYRLPILLCELQGKTRPVVAKQLGWPEGTVAGRLHRGKQMLAARLTRRGVTLSVAALTGVFAKEGLACVPLSQIATAVRLAKICRLGEASPSLLSESILTFSHGALETMKPNRWMLIAMAVCFAALVCGLGYFGQALAKNAFSSTSTSANRTAENPPKTNAPNRGDDKKEKEEKEDEEHEQEVDLRKVPAKAKAAALKALKKAAKKKAKLTKAHVEAVLMYEVEGKANGKEYEILVTAEGKVVSKTVEKDDKDEKEQDDDDEAEHELDIPLKAMPKKVMDAAKKAVRGIKLSEASVMSVLVYEFEAVTGDRRYEIEVTAKGNVLEVETGKDKD